MREFDVVKDFPELQTGGPCALVQMEVDKVRVHFLIGQQLQSEAENDFRVQSLVSRLRGLSVRESSPRKQL